MDFTRFKTPDWLVIGGGLAVLIGGFLDWFSVDGGGSGGNAFDFTLTGLIPWILIVAAAVIAFLRAGGMIKDGGPPWTLIILGLTALGAILLLIRLIIGADASDFGDLPDGVPDFGLDRAFGLWLTALGGVVAAVGAFLGFQAAGGNVRDLTDMDKMKSAFK